ncbi:MAG: hypothetical protein AAGC82_15485 [Pseudomonadota bacterium]
MTRVDFQDFLDAISDCFIEENFAGWRARIVLPMTMTKRHGSEHFTTEDALAENFALYIDACRILALDQIVRRPISLEDCGDGTWLGTYETNLLSRGQRAVAPYISTALLHPDNHHVRFSAILNARGHHEWTDAG